LRRRTSCGLRSMDSLCVDSPSSNLFDESIVDNENYRRVASKTSRRAKVREPTLEPLSKSIPALAVTVAAVSDQE
jgi:hypothetical protein